MAQMGPARWNSGNCFLYLTPISDDGVKSALIAEPISSIPGKGLNRNRVDSGTDFRSCIDLTLLHARKAQPFVAAEVCDCRTNGPSACDLRPAITV